MLQGEPISQALHVHRLDGVVLCVIFSMTYCSHRSDTLGDAKMRYGLYSFFPLSLLNDFGSFALRIGVKSLPTVLPHFHHRL